jgi:exonuclease SbcD
VTGREGHENYAPCTVEELRSKGYDYWALGHVHQAETLHDDPPIVFPGNLQGRHIRETGAKGAVLVSVDGGRVVAREHKSLDVMRWAVCTVDATGAATEDDLVDRARQRLAILAENSEGRPLIARVAIHGPCLAHDRLAGRFEKLSAAVRWEARDLGEGRLWIEKVSVRTRPERVDPALDGPIRAVRDYLERLRADPTELLKIGQKELGDLKRKVSRFWEDGSGRRPIDSVECLAEALDHIGPELLVGLSGSNGEVES